MKKTSCVLLLSGGIDSTTLLVDLKAQGCMIHALSFDYGQRHHIELDFARNNAKKYQVESHHILNIDYKPMAEGNLLTDVDFLPGAQANGTTTNSNYVPGRNLIMLSHAAAFAESKGLSDIYFAANADDGKRFPDCSPLFFETINTLMQVCPNTAKIQVNAPYINFSKSDVIRKSLILGVDLNDTISCYNPTNATSCGQCLSCQLREEAICEVSGGNIKPSDK